MGTVNYNKRVNMHILGTEKKKMKEKRLNVDYGDILGFQSGERAMSCILYSSVAL